MMFTFSLNATNGSNAEEVPIAAPRMRVEIGHSSGRSKPAGVCPSACPVSPTSEPRGERNGGWQGGKSKEADETMMMRKRLGFWKSVILFHMGCGREVVEEWKTGGR
jgi:hypothetical protein